MSKKAILLTFVSAVAVVCLAGILSYLVWSGQPSADTNPPQPPIPAGAPADRPPVPFVPRLAGDILDDGIVDALDINSIIVHWKTIALAYNLVDTTSEKTGTISSLDLNQTIKYWRCTEGKGEAACPYLAASNGGNDDDNYPPTPNTPTYSITATASVDTGNPPSPNTPGPND